MKAGGGIASPAGSWPQMLRCKPGYKSHAEPLPLHRGTWANPRHGSEDALWAQQAFSRPFERGDLRWRRVGRGPSGSRELSKTLFFRFSLVSRRSTSPSLSLSLALAVSHTPPHLFYSFDGFLLPSCLVPASFIWGESWSFFTGGVLIWCDVLCEVVALFSLFEVTESKYPIKWPWITDLCLFTEEKWESTC